MTKTKAELTIVDAPETERIENEEKLEVGQWYWVTEWKKDWDGKDYGEPYKTEWFGCIVYIGSNYVKVQGVNCSQRIHIENEFDELCRREPDPQGVIRGKIGFYQDKVRQLMGEIKQLTSKLGLTPRGELSESGGTSEALVVAHGMKDIKAHKKALIKAKQKTLPDLFEKVRKQHERMANWMKAELIPMEAQTKALKKQTEGIEDRIFTVELYAGLIEEMVQIRKGKTATNDDKIHLFQRRHYMDEECLVAYEAGGMEFQDIRAFDKWLCRKANMDRILPFPKCIVAFQVRRNAKDREAASFSDFINIMYKERDDKRTFIYIRNGQQVYRLSTGIDFGEQLFPDRDHSITLGGGGGTLYTDVGWGRVEKLITEGEYLALMEEREEARRKYDEEKKIWDTLTKKQKAGRCSPWYSAPHEQWEACTPESVYYDDAMKLIARQAMEHNRVAVVLQGILDRSPALHPHPPWKLWTPEGFSGAIELVYDQTRALTDGDAPDFEAYRKRLNASLKKGSMAVGQEDYWERVEAEKENKRQDDDYRVRYKSNYVRYRPYGDPGPGLVAKVTRVFRTGECMFEWVRERKIRKWVPDPKRSRYLIADDSGVRATMRVPASWLLNVDAYTPGDFHQFFDDPRTRAMYLKWAPLLLAAEDYHAGKGRKSKERTVYANGTVVTSTSSEDWEDEEEEEEEDGEVEEDDDEEEEEDEDDDEDDED